MGALSPLRDSVASLVGEGPDHDEDEVNEHPDSNAAKRQQLQYASTDFANVEPVDAKKSEEEAQQKGRKNSLLRETSRLLQSAAAWAGCSALMNLFATGSAVHHLGFSDSVQVTFLHWFVMDSMATCV
jgi:hypothetical protein